MQDEEKKETPTEDSNKPKGEVDYQSLYTDLAEQTAQMLERVSKIEEEKDNYKQGMLKAKKALKEQGFLDEEEEDERESRIVNKVVESIKPLISFQSKEKSESEKLAEKLRLQLEEIKEAQKAKSQISNIPNGGQEETKSPKKDDFFSDAQTKELQARGWSKEKIEALKENIKKQKQRVI